MATTLRSSRRDGSAILAIAQRMAPRDRIEQFEPATDRFVARKIANDSEGLIEGRRCAAGVAGVGLWRSERAG